MKRKYFSALLMASLALASTSMVTSCKDYDDDINSLKQEITNNATTLTKLVEEKQTNLSTELTTLKSQQSTLEKSLENAQATLNAAIEKAKTDANAYADVQAAAAQQAAIEAAKANVDSAVETIEAALAAANQRIDGVEATSNLNATKIAALLEADNTLQNAINEVKAEAAAAAQDAKDAAEKAQNTADTNAANLAKVSEDLTKVNNDLSAAITALSSTVEKNVAAIAANKADADAKYAEVIALIKANETAIADLKDADAALLAKINKNTTDLQALVETVAANKAACELNYQNAKAYTDAEVAALKTEILQSIAQTNSKLEGLSTELAAAKQDIADALTKIAANQTAIGKIADLNVDGTKDLVSAVNTTAAKLGSAVAKLAIVEDAISDLDDTLTNYISSNDIEIQGIKNAATALQAQVEKNTADITELKDKVADIEAEYAKTADVTSQVTALKDLITDLQDKISEITGDEGYVDALTTKLEGVKEDLENHKVDYDSFKTYVTNELDELWRQLSQTNDLIASVQNSLQDQIDVLAGYSHQLKSLVFSPQEYYQGIEAIGIYSYNYAAYGAYDQLPVYDESKDQIAANKLERSEDSVSVVPDVTAEYYLNPSNATVDTVLSHYKFIVNNAKYTRAASASDLVIKSVKAENGKALITFKMKDASKISNISEQGKVDVAALQYTYKSAENDTTVTSDWAALKNYVVENFRIRKASAEGKTEEYGSGVNYLVETAAMAIAPNTYTSSIPTLEIQYDNTEGIDLDKWITVDYNYAEDKLSVWGGQKTVNKKGFKLKYDLVGYIAAGHDTNESAHAKLEGSKLTLQGYKGAAADRQIIGRTPLVRVCLVDENSGNQVAAVGYILVKITDKAVQAKTVEANPIDNAYTVMCDGNALDSVQAITWEEVENKVLADLHVSKTEFEANWEFDDKNQYEKKEDGTLAVAESKFGTVAETTTDKGGHQTEVLTWTVTNNEAYDLFVTKEKTEKSVWVKFVPTKTTDAPVYVQLTWKPSAINKTPEATILNDATHKKTAAWHAADANTPGFDQLHIQVGNATVEGATCKYQSLVIPQTFNMSLSDIVKGGLGTTYKALADRVETEFVFAPTDMQSHKTYTGVSGTKYKIEVVENGHNIVAWNLSNNTFSTLAAMQEGGKIYVYDDPRFEADLNNVKDILNAYENRSDLKDALTFTVMAKATTCEPAANLINIKNSTFDVKVIKPIFVAGQEITTMQLNNASTLTQPVNLGFTDFNGYSESQFLANSDNKVVFKDFYEIYRIKVNKSGITTNYSGTTKAYSADDFDVTLSTITESGVNPSVENGVMQLGKITLTQKNQARTNGYKVWVPVEITYKWGTLKTTITLDVKAAPSARRH